MVQAILSKYEHDIGDITVTPSRGGVFEVIVGEELIFSKKELGRHATIEEVMDSLAAIIGSSPDPEG